MIEVGEYVRTKKGKIFQYGKGRAYLGKDNEIVNHSKNLIDLIEVGDYVNENRVYKITSACIYCVGKAVQNKLTINIETILTKEQYMQNCYKIHENISDIN